jgi:hypothetical protein
MKILSEVLFSSTFDEYAFHKNTRRHSCYSQFIFFLHIFTNYITLQKTVINFGSMVKLDVLKRALA